MAAGKRNAEVEQLKDRDSTDKAPEPVVAVAAVEPVPAVAAPEPAPAPAPTPSVVPEVAVAAAAVTAAAVAAELDARYVEELLAEDPEDPVPDLALEPEPEPEPESEPVVETAAPLVAESAVDEEAFDHDFDLSLDEFDEAPVAEVAIIDDLDDLLLDEPLVASASDNEELSFESIMQQQADARAAAGTDDLTDFDLDLSEEEPALKTEDDLLLSLEDDALDLGETTPEALADLELPEDFDLSLADEIETDQATQAFASEIEDVNAELDRLSQNLEHPPLDEPRFTAEDAALEDEPEFDFLSGTDEAATKLDLARAYIDMGDADGARDILDEVVSEGDDGQKSEARDMLSRLA
ncbi:LysM domain-containing protein [Pseudomonas cichorii]|uniref:LysM domain-containing protein n=1 Tax=Pseudomonas cichorii TaxID=36746 RepID=A0A3M4LFV1_PSECI|nr:LysM domain-containing protein [Pseudomonas cichorii]